MKKPFKGVTDTITENNRGMQQWMAGYATDREQQRNWPGAWTPATDIFMRDNGDLVVLAELPGVRREDVDLSISGGELTICGEKDGHEEAEYYTAERYSGSFKRTISLPKGLNEDWISTSFDGCLPTITIRDYAEILQEEQIEIG